ncbi:MAG: methyltransferase domain-containing protein [Myxococcota bacterium]
MNRPDEDFFLRYGDLELQRRMVMDRTRTEAFVMALEAAIRPGMQVLDLGCGTGLLAMAAARAGGEVVAIERTDIAHTAAQLIRAHDLQDRIRVLRGDVTTLELDTSVEMIVSEWLGNLAFVEDMWPVVARTRDRFLASNGIMIPEQVVLFLAPVDDPVLYYGQGPGQWRTRMAGFDFSSLEALELQQGRAHQIRIEDSSLLGPAQVMHDLVATKDDACASWFEKDLSLPVTRTGTLLGFAGWFTARLYEDVLLDTGPAATETHWSQTYLPFPPIQVSAGTKLAVRIRLEPHPQVAHNALLTIETQNQRIAYHLE